jgi:hypothetical protein
MSFDVMIFSIIEISLQALVLTLNMSAMASSYDEDNLSVSDIAMLQYMNDGDPASLMLVEKTMKVATVNISKIFQALYGHNYEEDERQANCLSYTNDTPEDQEKRRVARVVKNHQFSQLTRLLTSTGFDFTTVVMVDGGDGGFDFPYLKFLLESRDQLDDGVLTGVLTTMTDKQLQYVETLIMETLTLNRSGSSDCYEDEDTGLPANREQMIAHLIRLSNAVDNYKDDAYNS